jgi:pilus assembly protein CpaB
VGTLSLVLRNQVDQKTVATAGVTKNELFGDKKAPAPQPAVARKARFAARPGAPVPARRAQCVEVIQHGTSALSCF